jgi:acyl-CoA synthetase (AMP-forming)/AMP-acid ligase II
VQGWGLSEFTNFATCTELPSHAASPRHPLLDYAWPAIGRALPGFEVQVRGPQGAVLAPGMKGELFVRGASRMLGYFGHPPTADDWLATGDEGYCDEDERGALFFITGRLKDLIIRDAEKLSPLAIERRLLASCPQLAGRLAVVGFPHAVHGEEIGAYLESDDVDAETVDSLLRGAEALPDILRPKVVLCGASPIPRTHTGKVQRLRLRALFALHDRCSGPTRVECMA